MLIRVILSTYASLQNPVLRIQLSLHEHCDLMQATLISLTGTMTVGSTEEMERTCGQVLSRGLASPHLQRSLLTSFWKWKELTKYTPVCGPNSYPYPWNESSRRTLLSSSLTGSPFCSCLLKHLKTSVPDLTPQASSSGFISLPVTG